MSLSGGLATARVSTNSFRNLGGLGLERNFRQIWNRRRSPTFRFHRPLTSPACPSLRSYRRAETADGPRRRQSVLHMRAQMLRSLFLARRASIHGRRPPVRCLPPLFLKFVHFLLENTLELGLNFKRFFCKFGPESTGKFHILFGGLPIQTLVGANPWCQPKCPAVRTCRNPANGAWHEMCRRPGGKTWLLIHIEYVWGHLVVGLPARSAVTFWAFLHHLQEGSGA